MNHDPAAESNNTGSRYELLFICAMAIAVFLIYAKTLSGDFIFDDRHNIKDNPHIRLTHITLDGLLEAAHESPSANRPVANISFALNYYFHRYQVAGYHLVNVFIHIVNGLLLYLFIKTTFRTPALRSRYAEYGWIPVFATVIWLVHPVQTESVSYIVQRMNSMAAMFYVLAMLLYAEARLAKDQTPKRVLFSACFLSGLLALGSKEIAATLPFFIFLYEWYFFQDLSRNWLKRRFPLLAAAVIFPALLSLIYIGVHPLERIWSAYAKYHLTMPQRILTEFRVVIFYISLLLWPHPARLNLDHEFAPSFSLMDPWTTALSALIILGLIGLAVLLAKKDRLISYCILWFFGNLVIESSFVSLELVFEHRNYLPSMLFFLMAVVLIYRYAKPRWVTSVILLTAAAACALGTYQRNDVWRDPILIWKDSIAKSPQNPRPYNNLAVALAARGYYPEAVDLYRKALQISPNYPDAHANLGYALARQGRLDDAIDHFLTALKFNPQYYEAQNNLGIALVLKGRYQEAIDHFRAALKINPDFEPAHNNLGVSLRRQGKLQEAIDHFSAALRLNPNFAEAHNNLGMALASRGLTDEAVAHFEAALQIEPGYTTARRNLEEALAEKKSAPQN